MQILRASLLTAGLACISVIAKADFRTDAAPFHFMPTCGSDQIANSAVAFVCAALDFATDCFRSAPAPVKVGAIGVFLTYLTKRGFSG